MTLWNKNTEVDFFKNALKNFAMPEQLFYKLQSHYYAYIPKNYSSEGKTLQSRNSLIGKFTEKWCSELFKPIAKQLGLHAVNNVVCDEIGLTYQSSADLAFCKTNETRQKSGNINLIFEIKMSIVSNYEYIDNNNINYIGDFTTHKGNPSLLRSDSMLKAIGKAINIRVSGFSSSSIPIIILGNSPITKNYINKVDFLKTTGVIQGFWSLYPKPIQSNYIEKTPKLGFQTIKNKKQLFSNCSMLINNKLNYFSSMISKAKLGEIIRIASKESTDIAKAEKFISLIQK